MRTGRVRLPRQVVTLLLALVTASLVVLIWPPYRDFKGTAFYLRPLMAPLQNLEWFSYDVFEIFGTRKRRIDPRIVIVGYDRQSEETLGAWPPKRHVHADLICRLKADGAALIVYDTLFTDPSTPTEDGKLDAALQAAGNVISTCRVEIDQDARGTLEAPYYDKQNDHGIDFEEHSRMIGFADIVTDQLGHTNKGMSSDRVVRRIYPVRHDPSSDTLLPSLPVAAYLALNGLSRDDLHLTATTANLGALAVPLSGPAALDFGGNTLPSSYIDFAGGNSVFPVYSFEQAVDPAQRPPGFFRGKVVFIGLTGSQLTQSQNDRFTTAATHLAPVAETEGSVRGDLTSDVPGVMIHAQTFNALLNKAFISPMSDWLSWLIVFGFAFGAIGVTRRFMDWRGPTLLALTAVVYVVVSFGIFYQWSTYLPTFIPLVLVIVAAGIISWTERGSLRKMWSGYVSPAVLEHILRTGAEQGAQQYLGTIVFGDIRNFTGFSEAHDAPTVVRLLNRHLERITTVVYDEEGTVDKFLGDGILVVFGAPVPQEDGAVRAVRASIRMRDISLQPFPDDDGTLYTLSSGFGVTTGPFVAGHVGSRQRHDFSVIGDTVNLSSRLQGVTGKPDVIIDEPTYERVRAHVEVESLGEVTLKGKTLPVQCYRVLSWSDEAKVGVGG